MTSERMILVPKLESMVGCHKCKACVRGCPSEAITWEGMAPQFDINTCSKYQYSLPDEEDCYECTMSCRQGLVKLKPLD